MEGQTLDGSPLLVRQNSSPSHAARVLPLPHRSLALLPTSGELMLHASLQLLCFGTSGKRFQLPSLLSRLNSEGEIFGSLALIIPVQNLDSVNTVSGGHKLTRETASLLLGAGRENLPRVRPSFKVGGLGGVRQLHSSPGLHPPERRRRAACRPRPRAFAAGASRLAPLTGMPAGPFGPPSATADPKKPGARDRTSRARVSAGSYGYARTVTPGKWPGAGPYDYYFRVGIETTVSPGRHRAYWVTSPFPHPRRVVASVAPLTGQAAEPIGAREPSRAPVEPMARGEAERSRS